MNTLQVELSAVSVMSASAVKETPVKNTPDTTYPHQLVIGAKTAVITKIAGHEVVERVIWDGGNWVWNKSNYPSFTTGRYLKDGNNHFIVIISAGHIIDVYDIAMIDHYLLVALTPDGPIYDGRCDKIVNRIKLKKHLSKILGIDSKLVGDEQHVNSMLLEQTKKKLDALAEEKRAKEEAEKKARTERNAAIRQKVFGRPEIKGYTGVNLDQFFRAHPVVDDEWLRLPGGTFCVEVKSYDEESKSYGEIVGCFIVKQDGARKTKTREGEFSIRQGEDKAKVNAIGKVVYIDEDKDPASVILYDAKTTVDDLRHAGLNSGTVVAVKTDNPEKFDLYTVTAKRVTKKGNVTGAFFPFDKK